jgi:hypothetical protein
MLLVLFFTDSNMMAIKGAERSMVVWRWEGGGGRGEVLRGCFVRFPYMHICIMVVIKIRLISVREKGVSWVCI